MNQDKKNSTKQDEYNIEDMIFLQQLRELEKDDGFLSVDDLKRKLDA